MRSLKGLDVALGNVVEVINDNVQSFSEQISEVIEELQCEQRTSKMLNLIATRLKEEISDCRVETAKANIVGDQTKHDLVVALNSLNINKQDLLEDETALEKIVSSMKTRKSKQAIKLSLLNSITVEGEQSVMKIQQSLLASSPVAANVRKKSV